MKLSRHLHLQLEKAEARIAELEKMLRGFKDQPHACIDRDGPVTLLRCPNEGTE
ncbi:hypothetical protein LCGC14_1820220 [marine sediment metagenome]|uniref:Uncharacterized protein n=1 Tax=marine sediment metagenome TaxID=412755 RepID=A0A0F9GJA8_9ZZZZ